VTLSKNGYWTVSCRVLTFHQRVEQGHETSVSRPSSCVPIRSIAQMQGRATVFLLVGLRKANPGPKTVDHVLSRGENHGGGHIKSQGSVGHEGTDHGGHSSPVQVGDDRRRDLAGHLAARRRRRHPREQDGGFLLDHAGELPLVVIRYALVTSAVPVIAAIATGSAKQITRAITRVTDYASDWRWFWSSSSPRPC
jgi:hypothetical protein